MQPAAANMVPAPSNVTVPKMSFASVAALGPRPQNPNQSNQSPLAAPEPVQQNGNSTQVADQENALPARAIALSPDVLQQSLSQLNIKHDLRTEPRSSTQELGPLPTEAHLDDGKTQLSISSTKAASIDGKSIASGATFALDEKESIRPDDSASVQAAEDDDSNSGPGSGAPNSRMGSEAGGKAFRDQFHEISERMGPAMNQRSLPLARRLVAGIPEEARRVVPTVGSTMNPVAAGIARPEAGLPGAPPLVYTYSEPDEKLLDAMETPKDRLFLLQLEQQVISFIRDSQDPVLDLPPCNSFCRLLAHRLGDYYALSHFVDNSVSAVRLYRTPYCRLPTPLSAYSRGSTNVSDTPASQPSMKIMRRAGMGADGQIIESEANTAASSVGPSKANSEAGDESQRASGLGSPSESSVTKDKASRTREEREAKYKEARDRIFADWKDNESNEANQSNEDSNDPSRASSTNGKKKKKKNNDDDGFQARSAYNVYYAPAPQRPGQSFDQANQPNYTNNFMPPISNPTVQQGVQQAYSQPFQSVQQMPAYPMSMPQQGQMGPGSNMYPTSGPQGQYMPYGQQMNQMNGPYYPPMPPQNQMGMVSSTMSSPALSNRSVPITHAPPQMVDQSWNQGTFQAPYQAYGPPQVSYQQQSQPPMQAPPMQAPPMNALAMPYAYGQLPTYPQNGPTARAMHPLPGSYTRQNNFNPQSRAFVPGNGHFSAPPNIYGNRPGPQPLFPVNSATPTLPQPPVPLSTLTNQFQQYSGPPSTPRKTTGQVPRTQSPGQSTLSKWGTPSTLPPKPPPPASSNPSANVHLHGQGMPAFQNGTYSKPL